jgi:hypothetical protein
MDPNHTAVFPGLITEPAAWDSTSVGGKAGITHTLTRVELSALARILERRRGSPTEQLTRADFAVPELEAFVSKVRNQIMHGSGVVIISGVTRELFAVEDFERLFWGIGVQLGSPAVQNAQGHRIGHVRNEADNPRNRGYMSDRELGFHSDAFEIVGLMCLANARSGGLSRIVSTLTVHNELMKRDPHVLDALYRGYPYATAERAATDEPVTSYSVPVFSLVNDRVSSMCVDTYMLAAAKAQGVALPADLEEGLERFFETCSRSDLVLEFLLEPGEMLFFNNFTTVHARTKFEDGPNERRHLLRLWLNVPDGRPVVPALLARGADYERLCRR